MITRTVIWMWYDDKFWFSWQHDDVSTTLSNGWSLLYCLCMLKQTQRLCIILYPFICTSMKDTMQRFWCLMESESIENIYEYEYTIVKVDFSFEIWWKSSQFLIIWNLLKCLGTILTFIVIEQEVLRINDWLKNWGSSC